MRKYRNRVVYNALVLVLVSFICVHDSVVCEKILFPSLSSGKAQMQDAKENKDDGNKNEIPLDLIKRLNSISNASELFKEFNMVKEERKILTSGFGGSLYAFASKLRASPLTAEKNIEDATDAPEKSIERSSAVTIPKPAGCIPESTTVPLWQSTDRTIFSFPSCIRVERCGGCCQHELLSCQPTNTEIINYQVILTQFIGDMNNLVYKGKEVVPIERHTKCKCDCITKASDCNDLQEYKENICNCVCTNTDEEQKCLLESNKLWNPHTCICQCHDVTECSTGHFFNEATCQCEAITALSVRSKNDRHEYNVYKVLPNNFRSFQATRQKF